MGSGGPRLLVGTEGWLVSCHDLSVDLTITHLGGTSIRREFIERPYALVSGFERGWWNGWDKGPVEFFSFMSSADGEVARAMTRPRSTIGDAYPTFDARPGSVCMLEFFEVRSDLHWHGYGRLAVDLLLDAFPDFYVGFSRNSGTDGFWQKAGWHAHLHEDAATHGDGVATLFVAPG